LEAMLTNKTVTYELFDLRVVVFLVGGCAVGYEEEHSVTAIVNVLISAKLRAYAQAHDLYLYVRPVGGAWRKMLTIEGGGTAESDITDFVKTYPRFDIKMEHCVPWWTVGSHRITGSLEITYTPPPEVTAPPGYTGEFIFGEPTLGVMFEYMMNMMIMFMFMSMMMAMMTAMTGV